MTPQLVLTREAEDAARFAKAIRRSRDIGVIVSPVFRIVPVAARVAAPPDHVVFTSARAIPRAKALLPSMPHAWCVGPRTTAAAKEAGFEATEGGGDVESLTQTLLEARPRGEILHLHGRHVRGDLAERLRAAGLQASGLVIYDQQLRPPTPALVDAAKRTDPLVFPLFSPRAALMLGQIAAQGPVHVVAMSGAVAEAAQAFEVETIQVAEAPNEPEMIVATLRAIDALTGCA